MPGESTTLLPRMQNSDDIVGDSTFIEIVRVRNGNKQVEQISLDTLANFIATRVVGMKVLEDK